MHSPRMTWPPCCTGACTCRSSCSQTALPQISRRAGACPERQRTGLHDLRRSQRMSPPSSRICLQTLVSGPPHTRRQCRPLPAILGWGVSFCHLILRRSHAVQSYFMRSEDEAPTTLKRFLANFNSLASKQAGRPVRVVGTLYRVGGIPIARIH